MQNMIKLESVGTVIDEDGMTYPMLAGGGYDADEGTEISVFDVNGEWWGNLSDADYDTVMGIWQRTTNIKVCRWCGSRYRPYREPLTHRYCSDDCATDAHNLEEPR